MFFALTDYMNYRRRSGVYGDDPTQNIMALGHLGRIPPETLSLMERGDLLLTQKLNSSLSWAVMYFCNYPVDHSAIYLGDAEILHVTLAGTAKHPLRVLGKQTRILPIRLDFAQMQAINESGPEASHAEETHRQERRRFHHLLPPKGQLAWVAMRIVLGLEPVVFRWRVYIDLLPLTLLIDFMFLQATVVPITSIVWSFWAIVIAVRLRIHYWKVNTGRPIEHFSHPGEFLTIIRRTGGAVLPHKGIKGYPVLRVLSVDRIYDLLRQRGRQ